MRDGALRVIKFLFHGMVASILLGVAILILTPSWHSEDAGRSGANLPPRPSTEESSAKVASDPEAELLKAEVARPRAPVVRSWPAKDVVLARAGTSPRLPTAMKIDSVAKAKLEERDLEEPLEPPAPLPEEVKELATWNLKAPETPARVRDTLLDSSRSSTVKLIAMDKLRDLAPEKSVPILVEFVNTEPAARGACTKASAIGLLAAMDSPLARTALDTLYATSDDDRVRVAISSFLARGAKK